MKTIVQKYGGSSVATDDKLRHVAERLLALHRAGHGVVTVVSAMGDTTNHLLDLAQGLNHNPPGRELDLLLSSGERISSSLLAMAIRAQGVPAVALTGAQAGIHTSDRHLNARIMEVDPGRVREELAAGRIVVVAGFQGIDPHGEITTLGRGGSDTTAVALAAALDADGCDICSDVDGIYSA
ncbi:MAG: aspartate kinase, partial [Gammaproteobacteria bacterium]